MNNSPVYRIWHVGNWCAHWGDQFRESAFHSAIKNFEVLNYARLLVEALQSHPGTEVRSIPSWEMYHLSPKGFDQALDWADIVIFGDVETQSLQLNPEFFRNQFKSGYLTFPDRFDLLREWIRNGGHFHMMGGWSSFSGHQGFGGWGRSRWQKDTDEKVLPVECLLGDDLIESTSSFEIRTPNPDHPYVAGLNLSTLPPLLGFNETKLYPGAESIIEIRNGTSWYPLLAERKFGKGYSSVWTTSASPHWGINFMKWPHYAEFWGRVLLRSGR